MRFIGSLRKWLYGLLLPGLAACAGPDAPFPQLHAGPLWLRPSGFFDWIAVYRTASTADSVYTRFGRIPLRETPDEFVHSPRHSRIAMEAALKAAGDWLGYYEADFLDPAGRSNYRLRQLWGQYQGGSWQILAGQAWSLLRPNRVGISARSDLMNTIAVEPAYHVGLAGGRNRQLRITKAMGAWQAALAYEYRQGGDVAAKLAHDGGRAHWEVMALAGHGDRRAAGAAAVVKLSSRLRWVSEQLWSQGCGPDLVGGMPVSVHAHSVIEGAEAKLTAKLELFVYGGLAYATKSAGNRVLRQWTAGFHRILYYHGRWGSATLSFQYSQLDRSTWPGGHGEMNYFMIALRHNLPSRR